MLVSLFFMNAFIFITFFAKNIETLLVGQIFCGLTWGVFATTGPAYASEVCPLALRGYLTVYVNLCWAIGQFIAAGVLNGLIDLKSQWAYRIVRPCVPPFQRRFRSFF
jgi:SP family general alpha glucoside:H+ symporter-like MFS transporter